jgi:hypothetical protein
MSTSTTANGKTPHMVAELFDRIMAHVGGRPGGDGSQWYACCPAHPDTRPSLSGRLAGNRILLHCHRGCSFDGIAAALERQLGIDRGVLSDKPAVIATYPYHGRDGGLIYEALRYFPKSFKVRRRGP